MSRINFFVDTFMWSFRILCVSQAGISVIWSSRSRSKAAGNAVVFSKLATGLLSYGRLEDLCGMLFMLKT